ILALELHRRTNGRLVRRAEKPRFISPCPSVCKQASFAIIQTIRTFALERQLRSLYSTHCVHRSQKRQFRLADLHVRWARRVAPLCLVMAFLYRLQAKASCYGCPTAGADRLDDRIGVDQYNVRISHYGDPFSCRRRAEARTGGRGRRNRQGANSAVSLLYAVKAALSRLPRIRAVQTLH